MIKIIKTNKERGAALLLYIILIFSIILIIGAGLTSLTLNSLNITNNKIESIKSYYTAEAGIEDSLLRLNNEMQFSTLNTLIIDNNSATTEISDLIGGSRTITSEGNADDKVRKLSVNYSITTSEISFFYGAQAGDGGITMGNNSVIEGNVFSNGNVSGGGTITNTVTVANNGNGISGVEVGDNAYVYSCSDADIEGTLYYVSDGVIDNCDYGSIVDLGPEEIKPEAMPISPEQIINWKNEASSGGTFSGDYTVSGGESVSLGPIKITGNLIVNISAILNVTGLIYVEGDILINNNVVLKLDSGFGSQSGIIINDGKISVQNGAAVQGSGEDNSFLMLLSTNNSIDPGSPAINVRNNAAAAIFYASNGMINLNNNINIREATGYKLALSNNAVVSYDSGLANANFSSGPGGSWQVENWKEIE
ncbi:hypothetical protein KKH96_02820 [Patescibacteria group bacterium]|nr:hypothetical protein [Patescibacteria group bacterium]